MARFARHYDQKTIEKFDKAGRGTGEGPNYHPWIEVYDIPSTGRSWTVRGWKSGRRHHLLSDLEYKFFLVAEWSGRIIDIREQFPLRPLDKTKAIAAALKIKHPIHPKSRFEWVMTTDFLLTLGDWDAHGNQILHARTCKYKKDLASVATLGKFEIERQFWQEQGVDWAIVTERDIPETLADNVQKLHQSYFLPEFHPQAEIVDIAQVLTDLLSRAPDVPLRQFAKACDERLGYQRGSALAVIYYLIATKQWQIDMHVPLNPALPLLVTNIHLTIV